MPDGLRPGQAGRPQPDGEQSVAGADMDRLREAAAYEPRSAPQRPPLAVAGVRRDVGAAVA
ncbi:hypothetical protein ETD86_30000 [Nonomuraea turkmeniaca]|uniref:Uncharacterized protein n=1 Tax=Nonomuraea turkmeniaca TaxID=103838 RepID=A0A5S4FAU8_9ACTN|nr:hypothetical protein [Nonomuraea turkmeniaca]TMR13801.1 hypothetical protein ETD86_30000 [Nonomuraea turkmeniaca]